MEAMLAAARRDQSSWTRLKLFLRDPSRRGEREGEENRGSAGEGTIQIGEEEPRTLVPKAAVRSERRGGEVVKGDWCAA
jgi:hypothetical protein